MGRVGSDRQKKFDDIFASQVNTGTVNQKFPSTFEKPPPKVDRADAFKPDPNLNVIDLDHLAQVTQERKKPQKHFEPVMRNLNSTYQVNDVVGGKAGRGIVDGHDFADPLRRLERGHGKKFINGKHLGIEESQPTEKEKFYLPDPKLRASMKVKNSEGLVPIQFPRPSVEKPVRYQARSPFATFEDEMRSSVYSVMNRR